MKKTKLGIFLSYENFIFFIYKFSSEKSEKNNLACTNTGLHEKIFFTKIGLQIWSQHYEL